MPRAVIGFTILATFLFPALPIRAAMDEVGKCEKVKALETGKKAFALMKAFAKNIKAPDPSRLARDVSKARSKFTKGFSKAEARAECPTSGDVAAIEAKVDALVFDTIESLNICGDDAVNRAAEECDGADDGLCPGECWDSGTPHQCRCPFCGDDTLNREGEECDGTEDGACPGACIVPGEGGLCGDNLINGGDECTCRSEECDGTEDGACPGACIAPGGGGGFCGDNLINGGDECTCATEECDGADDGACPGECWAPGTLYECECAFCGDDAVNQATEQCDGTDDGACPGICQINCRCPEPLCGNGIPEDGEECEPRCSQGPCNPGEICGTACECVPVAPCDCGTPDPPTSLDLTSEPGVGTCGEVRNSSDDVILELECGYTYVGGGTVGVSAKQESHLGSTVYPVECCNGTSLVLEASTEGETGSLYDCSSAGCLVGGPVPIVLTPPPISTCVYNNLVGDAWGSADCSTGDITIHLPIQTSIFLTGDLLPGRCDSGSGLGRACKADTACVGGLMALKACTADSDCPGGTCGCPDGASCAGDLAEVQSCPICNPTTGVCNGGPNDGEPCQPHTPEVPGPYPTSYDCPPDPFWYFGFTNLPWEYTTGTQTREAADGQFCGFCRDVIATAQAGDTGSLCFEGDHRSQCPDSATGECRPFSGETAACGTPIPCDSDADCFAPYESCEQRHAGAFGQSPARKITAVGLPPGDLRDRAPHAMTKVSVTCVPPTFEPYQDSTTDFPGPGVSQVPGVFQLRP